MVGEIDEDKDLSEGAEALELVLDSMKNHAEQTKC